MQDVNLSSGTVSNREQASSALENLNSEKATLLGQELNIRLPDAGKIKQAVLCLYISAGIQIITAVYSILSAIRSYSSVNSNQTYNPGYEFTGSFILIAIIVVGSILISRELKKLTPLAWVAALAIFLFSAASYALPVCIIGLLSLLDEKVRGYFIQKLDIQI